jgi:hypothetical protein
MASRILNSVNGERTLAEILLHAHASEYLVIKFLFMLHGRGIVEIAGERPVDPQTATLLDTVEPTADELELPDEAGSPEEEADEKTEDPATQIERAWDLISRKEFAAALDILNRCYRARPDDNHLRHLLFQAESGYQESVRDGALQPSKIPVRLAAAEKAAEAGLQPAELFLLETLDGQTDIQSLTWIAPLREVDILRALERMLEKELIELRDPDPSRDGEDSENPVKAVQWSPF